jgi:hypothetical protein
VRPYVIRQGDHLAAIAYKFGFDADTVWNDPSNADLRKLRPDPNILWPTDVLYIPDPPAGGPPTTALTPGSTNVFVSTPATVTLTVAFMGDDPSTYASKAYTVQELDQLTGLATDGNGVATFPIPVNLKTATVSFSDSGDSYVLSIGAMDPIDTLSGIFSRLQNLGYIDDSAALDSSDLSGLRAGLRAFKASQASGGDSATGPVSVPSPPSAPASTPVTDTAPASSPEPEPSAPASGPGDAFDSGPASPPSQDSPPSTPSPNSAPPPSEPAPASAPASAPSATDNAGLADDGTLDADIKSLLLRVHGS